MPSTVNAHSDALPNTSRQDTTGIAIIVLGVVLLLTVHTLIGRLRGGIVELRRLPEHQFDFRVDINTANEIELQHLPGIGPTLAAKIVDDRTRYGLFKGIDDLLRVRGIGAKSLETMRPYLADPPAQRPRPEPRFDKRLNYPPASSKSDS